MAETPLHLAAYHGCLEIVKFLFADLALMPISKMERASTPLYSAALHGYLEIVKLLLDDGADANRQNK